MINNYVKFDILENLNKSILPFGKFHNLKNY